MKDRLKRELKKLIIILLVGFCYYLFVRFMGFGLVCMFNAVTGLVFPGGLMCPGCGITRMVMAIIRLDFYTAIKSNSFLFVTGPVLIGVLLANEIKYVKTGSRQLSKVNRCILIAETVLMFVFCITRNINLIFFS